MKAYPLCISNVTKSPIWGGTRLLRDWGKTSDAPTVGESWELTVRKNEKSEVKNGIYAGQTLESLIAEDPKTFLDAERDFSEFPLLIKLIDACDRLSVQVHPDDVYAKRVENDRGKTEMWYIVEADPGAEIICGLEKNITPEDFAKAVREGDSERVLCHCPVHAGETYFIPAGLPHAIGKGILIAEIQQNCDLTYRVYDYNRRQPDGTLRELHVEKALDVIRPFAKEEIEKIRYERTPDGAKEKNLLADCRYFRVEKWTATRCKKSLPVLSKMQHLLCLEGKGTLICDGVEYPIEKGDSYYLPVGLQVEAKGAFSGLLTTI